MPRSKKLFNLYPNSHSFIPRGSHTHLSSSTAICPHMCTLASTLNGHRDSVNATQFSPNRSYLVSGSEDGSLLIYSVGSWKPLLRFVDASPITSLVWHPKRRRVLFCGCKSGDIHLIQFSVSGVRSCFCQQRVIVLTQAQNSARCSHVDK